jgi:hypothetical protein
MTSSHIAKKRKQVNITIKQLNWLLGRKSNLAIENKILIYKTVIIPIWTYCLELWGCASKSNISIIQRSQSKILRIIVDASWYDPLLKTLLVREENRRLKRNWPIDLI